MQRFLVVGVIVVALFATASVLAEEGGTAPTRFFGFGGPMFALFLPDLEGVNAFLSESGQASLEDFLLGAGGSGRGGTIGGLSLGGMGFGVVAASGSEDARKEATLVVGAGGLDLGYALGGDTRSVLTAGLVLGGGATVLTLSSPAEGAATAQCPHGIVIEPVERVLGRGFAFVQPYVSLEAQLTDWLGLEVRIGYLLPVFGVDFGDDLGIPAPSLDLSGPFVGLSVLFGGISGEAGEASAGESEASGGSIDLGSRTSLVIENRSGDLVIASYPVDVTLTETRRTVDWVALRKASGWSALASLKVEVTESEESVALRTAGRGKVDYFVKVPAGTDLLIKQGAGNVTLASHTASAVTVALGAGEVKIDRIVAPELAVEVGAGTVTLTGIACAALMVHVGTGQIVIELERDVSATVAASVGLGDVDVSGFPGMTLIRQGFVGKTASAVLGSGAAKLTLAVGIGKIGVHPLAP